jgi:hypothetical protein
MDEQHFRFRRCSPQHLATARWQLLLAERGFAFEPLLPTPNDLDAA